MKVTINEREYELKELTKEEARAYIGKEVYVWDIDEDVPKKRKLLEVFNPSCKYPYCILSTDKVSTNYQARCAPVPEEWYVQQLPDGTYESICPCAPRLNTIDHGSKEYCEQKAKELNEQEAEELEALKAQEHPLTNYELAQLLKCFGVEGKFKDYSEWHGEYGYKDGTEKNDCPNDIIIRYKCGEWMLATRETVWKWWGEEVPNSDIARFISFMGWDEDKE